MKEHFEKQLERTNTWLSFAEAKNIALIVFNTAILGSDIGKLVTERFITIVYLFFAISIIICLLSFRPNLSTKAKEPSVQNITEVNLIYFGDIANIKTTQELIEKTGKKYFPEFDEIEMKDNMVFDLANEVLINSRIAMYKYNIFKRALITDIIGFGIIILALIIA